MTALASVLVLLFAQPQVQDAPAWVTFDVLNPEAAGGHRILHLDDMLDAKSGSARAVLLFTTLLDECSPRAGLCAEVGKLAAEVQGQGGVVIGLLLDPQETAPRARKEVPAARHTVIIAADAHGITRRALKLDRPSEIIVINSAGRIVRLSPPSESSDDLRRRVGDAKRAFLHALRRDKEDEG